MDFRSGLSSWLLARKVLKRKALEKAYHQAEQSGLWLEQVLLSQELVSREVLLQALSELSGVEAVDLANSEVDPHTAQMIPREMVDRFRLLCLSQRGQMVVVAMADPTDRFAQEFVKMRTGLEVIPRCTNIVDLLAAVEQAFAVDIPQARARPTERFRQLTMPLTNMIPGSQVAKTEQKVAAIKLDEPSPLAVSSRQDDSVVLKALVEVARDLVLTHDLDQLIVKILQNVLAIAEAEGASLILIDETGQELYFKESVGPRSEEVKSLRLPLGEQSIAATVVKNQASQIVNDTTSDQRHSKKVDQAVDFVTRSLVCCPVSWRGTPLGVLTAVNKKAGPFDLRDQTYLEMLAAHAAVALQNSSTVEQLRNMHYQTVGILVDVLEAFDHVSRDHMVEVARFATGLGRNLGLAATEIEQLAYASLLHDIGKVRCSDPLDPRHPALGAEMLQRVSLFDNLRPLIRHHHERYDGQGFPDGLAGDQIPPLARVLALAEAWVEEVQGANELERALAARSLRGEFGKRFDPALAQAYERLTEAGEERVG